MKYEKQWKALRGQGVKLEIAEIPWDSEIFKRPVYEICSLEIDSRFILDASNFLTTYLEGGNIHLCTARIEPEDHQALQCLSNSGFRRIQVGNELELDLNEIRENIKDSKLTARIATEQDWPLLLSESDNLFINDRFYLDTRLDSQIVDSRYRNWILNSLRQPSDSLVICSIGELPVGFFVARQESENTVRILLNALFKAHQGKGLAQDIWKAMMNWISQSRLTVQVSSNNHQSLKHWFRYNARVKSQEEILHYVR